MKMQFNWYRVLRTLIQTACGSGVALVNAICADWSKESIITSAIAFGSTVIVSVLMNINEQMEDKQ